MLKVTEKPYQPIRHVNGKMFMPIVTMDDGEGFTCHIYVEGCCYLIAVPCSWNSFTNATHIFPEVHGVFKTLPILEGSILKKETINDVA